MTRTSMAILGAGSMGLSAAYHAGARSLLIERENRVGGLCRSIHADGFTFDMAGDIMFLNSQGVHTRYSRDEDWRSAFVRAEDSAECEALEDCCADGLMEADLPRTAPRGSDEPRDFEEFIYRVWGAGIAKHFAIPYDLNPWTLPLEEMETSWLEGRVPLPARRLRPWRSLARRQADGAPGVHQRSVSPL